MFDMVSTVRCVAQMHPLLADLDEHYFGSFLSVGEMVDHLGIDYENYGIPAILVVEPDDTSWEVSVDDAYNLYLRDDQIVHVYPRVEGQTGGSLLSLGFALLAGPAATALSLTAGTLKYALFTTAFTALGGLLANMLIRPEQRSSRDDPNYSISGTSNVEAKHQPVPMVCGRMRMFPPKSARGFSTTRDNEIYWTTRLCLGYGRVGLGEIKIGDRPITDFQNVRIEFLNVDKDYTLANNPGIEDMLVDRNESIFNNVETVSGRTGQIVVPAPPNASLFEMTVSPAVAGRVESYDIKIYKRRVGTSTWTLEHNLPDRASDFEYSDEPSGPSEYRVTWDNVVITPAQNTEGRYKTPAKAAVTISSAYAALSSAEGAWRTGTETMQLYPSNIQEDQYSVVLQEDEGQVFPTAADASYAEVDITYAQGLYDSNDGSTQSHEASYSIEYRRLGTTAWVPAKEVTHRAESTSMIRKTEFVPFFRKGTYEIRVTRTVPIDNDAGDQNTGTLTAIRTFKDEALPSHKEISEIAIEIRASEQLNGNLDSVNAVVQSFFPTWTGTGWGARVPTRHPAWAFAQLVRGRNVEQPLEDTLIDRMGLRDWADEEPGWTFDYVFDSDTRMSEALALAAAAGRAKAHFPDLQLSAIRDGGDGPLTQAFGPHNYRNFSGTIRFRKEIHGFIVKVRSEAMGFEFDEIVVYMDGFDVNNATVFETLELPGVVLTNADVDQGNAFRLARYHLAQHYLRPETWTFETDFEWIVTQRGKKIKLTSDTALINVGQARVKSFETDGNGNVTTVTLSDIFPGAGGTDFLLTVRRQNGQFAQFTADPNNVLDGVWQVTSSDMTEEKLDVGDLVAIEELGQPFNALVVDIEPLDDEYARITCVPAAPEVLNAEEQIPPYDPVVTLLPDRFGPPVPTVLDVYSDKRSYRVARDGTIMPTIAVALAPYASKSPVWFRLRWTDPKRGGWIYGRRQSYDSTLFTDEITEGQVYTVEVRAEDKDENYQYWVRAGTVNGTVEAPTQGPGNWAGRPVYDGIDFDGTNPLAPSNPAIQRGTDVAGWNIYASDAEFGTYTFLQYTESLKTLISDTANVRWFRFAVVNNSGDEGPLGPAFYVPPFTGVDLDDLAQELRERFLLAEQSADDVAADIDDELDAIKLDIFGANYDFSKPLAERVDDFARTDNMVYTPNGEDGVGGWLQATVVNDRPPSVDVNSKGLTFGDGAVETPLRRGNPIARTYHYSGWFKASSGLTSATFRVGLRGGWSRTSTGILTFAPAKTVGSTWEFIEGEFTVDVNAAYYGPGIDHSGAGPIIDCWGLVMQEVTYAKTRYDVLAAVDGDNASAIEDLRQTKVDDDGVLSIVNQEISASYGSLSGMASATSFAKAKADIVTTGHMFRAIGGYWELVGMNDGKTDTSITRIKSDRILLAGDTQVAGSFHVSGTTVILDANTQINGGFQVQGGEVQLDSNTAITGGFQVTGPSVRIDSNTVIAGNFVLGGDHIILSSGTSVYSSFVLQGRHIQLDGNVSISGSFQVRGSNIRLDGNTVVDGSFEVTEGMIKDGLYLVKSYVARMTSGNSVGSQETILSLTMPQGADRYASINVGFSCKSNYTDNKNVNWKLFADLLGKGSIQLAGGNVQAPPNGETWVGVPIFDPRDYSNRSVVLTLVVESTNGTATFDNGIIEITQTRRAI